MQCFNCGEDADMEVLMMVNGKMKKMSICMKCYQEQMKAMMDMLSDEEGNINPDEIQKKMFEFFKEHKEEFETFLGEALNNNNFKFEDLSAENLQFTSVNPEEISGENISDILNKFNDKVLQNKKGFDFEDSNKINSKIEDKIYVSEDFENKEINNLIKAVKTKRMKLNQSIEKEDYLQAANLRDEIREMNKKIMIIKEFAKEGEA
ncbi:MAG: hypothetical protein Q4A42_05170 [Tissierellia bacterium]|nr:hypothetical protein [Tissierellia bacterium]